MNKMKILHVGNIASVGYYLSLKLREMGVHADVFDWRQTQIITRSGDNWVLRPSKSKGGFYSLTSLQIGKYDIIHLHYLHSDINLIQSLKHFMRAGTPIKIVHAHDSVNDGTKEFIPRIKSAIVRFGAKAIFYSTPNILENIDRFPLKKIFLPNPIDTSLFKPIEGTVYPNRVLCWVKLDPDKGYEKILEAIRLCPEVKFDIPEIGSLIHEIKPQLPDNAQFIPPCPHNKAPELINKYPLTLEQFIVGAFGISGLEAMSCGKPVVCYWKRKYDNFYSKACPVISAKEPDEIAKKIRQTLADPSNIGTTSREWVVKNHSLNVVAKELFTEYSKILNN
jgi:glycosyltransferase involved in cell wall biosynthesis